MRFKSRSSHALQAIAEGSLIALLIVGLMAGTALAGGKGGGGKPGGGSGGVTVQVVTDANGNGLANWADQVHFTVTTSNTRPIVSLTCTQGGTVVYGDSHPYYWPNIWDDTGVFTLSSLSWTSGAAECRAEAKGTSTNGRVVTLGSMIFQVGA
jgi:hypothetical protein